MEDGFEMACSIFFPCTCTVKDISQFKHFYLNGSKYRIVGEVINTNDYKCTSIFILRILYFRYNRSCNLHHTFILVIMLNPNILF